MNQPSIQDPITPLPPMRLLIFAASAIFPSVAYLVVRSTDGDVTLGGIAKIAAAWLIGYLISAGYYNHRMQVRLQALAFEVQKSLPELERIPCRVTGGYKQVQAGTHPAPSVAPSVTGDTLWFLSAIGLRFGGTG